MDLCCIYLLLLLNILYPEIVGFYIFFLFSVTDIAFFCRALSLKVACVEMCLDDAR